VRRVRTETVRTLVHFFVAAQLSGISGSSGPSQSMILLSTLVAECFCSAVSLDGVPFSMSWSSARGDEGTESPEVDSA